MVKTTIDQKRGAMSIAELHGKNAPEDTLTSAALGTLTFLPSERALVPWLRCARNLHGKALLLPTTLDPLDVEFWPSLPTASGRCEPDAVITYPADSIGAVHALLIEVKYRSGPSGLPTAQESESGEHIDVSGQLSREWLALDARADRTFPGAPQMVVSRRLLYITGDAIMPGPFIDSTARELKMHTGHNAAFLDGCYWLDWSSLHYVLSEQLEQSVIPKWERHALERLRSLLELRGLAAFFAIEPPRLRRPLPWSYLEGP